MGSSVVRSHGCRNTFDPHDARLGIARDFGELNAAFAALNRFRLAVGERHECARGDKGLHQHFVGVIEMIGRKFCSCGCRGDRFDTNTPLR